MTSPAPKTYEDLIENFAAVTKASESLGYLRALKDVIMLLEVKAGKTRSKLEIRTLTEIVEMMQGMKP
jgi:hypothetical protein